MLTLNDRHRAEHDGTEAARRLLALVEHHRSRHAHPADGHAAAYTLLHSFAEVFADPLAAALAQGDGHAFDALLLGVIEAAPSMRASAAPSR